MASINSAEIRQRVATMASSFAIVSPLLACFFMSASATQAQYVPLEKEFGLDSLSSELHTRFLDARRIAIPQILSPFRTPPKAMVIHDETPEPWEETKLSWRRGITATIFWVGESATERNPTPNHASSWDPNWQKNYGGVDHPGKRNGYHPAGFTPRLNPFYIALPYNDIAPGGNHQPEASKVIPWFWKSYRGNWSSVCKGRWVAIHYRGKVCYAQWEDCGPFTTDDWKYVFKGHTPKPNPNGNAGIDVSPSVRDFLGIRSGYRVAWKFVEDHEVPTGPWIY